MPNKEGEKTGTVNEERKIFLNIAKEQYTYVLSWIFHHF